MKNILAKSPLLPLIFLVLLAPDAAAQFKEGAFTQTYASPSDTTAARDSVDQMWSFKEFFRGVSHKDTLRIGSMFAGSTVFVGAGQIHNRQLWKLPIIYGGLGTTIGLGIHYNNLYKDSQKAYDAALALNPETQLTVDTKSKDLAKWMFAGAGLVYWGALMDETINYGKGAGHMAGKATIYSLLFPGLGQIYNGEYWKVPIYWGGIILSCHFYKKNSQNYKRFKRIHNAATSKDIPYDGSISAETALYYRNVYRRYRDYSVVAIAGSYLLQVIDANVFAYMLDFEVSDDLTMRITPTVISPYESFALNPSSSQIPTGPSIGGNAYGLRVGISF